MKKAMFAAAVMAAGAAMAVESGIVGYNNKTLRDSGNAITAQFLNIGSTEKFKLSDIKITGYQNNDEVKSYGGLISEEFNFTLLDYAGCTMEGEQYFFWYDEWDGDGEAWSGGQWWDIDYNPVNAENDYEFNASESFWFTSMIAPKDGEDKPTETYTFVDAGAVDANDRVYKLRDSGNLIGNPMPGVLKLSDVTITGYQNNAEVKSYGGLISEEFNFTYLDYAGCTMESEQYFFWYDEWDADGESWSGGCWWDIDYNPVVPEENDYDLQPGGAFWLTSMIAPKDEDDKPTEIYYIEFPTLVK